jgi:esterase
MEPSASFSIKASDGIELAADVWNQDAKATLFLLPAGAETRAVWRPVIDRLGAEVRLNWRIVAADHRGHGGSGRSETYQFEQLYRDLGKWIAELTADPLVVAGGSIGGALGMVAAGEGASIDGLVLLDVPVAPVLQRVLVERERIQSAAKIGHSSMNAIDQRFIGSGFVEDVYRDIDRWSRAARRLKIPTLLIAGGQSVIGPYQLQQYREHIPHGEFERLQTGHLVARDDPNGVADRLRSFLRTHWEN